MSLVKDAKSPDLEARSAAYQRARALVAKRIVVCAGTGCIANGSLGVYEKLGAAINAAGIDVELKLDTQDKAKHDILLTHSGCQGFCQVGPLVTIEPDGILYTKVREADIPEIVETTLKGGKAVERLLYVDPTTKEKKRGKGEIEFYNKQDRRVLASCGVVDPEDLEEYISLGGYKAARKAIFEMSEAEVCQVMKDSGLRGRGGAGFPTGRKWELALKQSETEKYIICNGDEGDPGAFMDRSVLEGNPHSVVEGMIVATWASVSTLLTTVGLPKRPFSAVLGGLGRGMPRPPMIDATMALASPQTKAPAPSITSMSKESLEPMTLLPRKPAPRASSTALRMRLTASGYSART